MGLAKRVRARLQSYNLFTSVANTNYTRQHIRLDTSAGRRTSSWLKKRPGRGRGTYVHTHAGETTRLVTPEEGGGSGGGDGAVSIV